MRTLTTLALAGLFGALLLAGDASACCHKKKVACAPACAPAPAPVCEPAPAPVCEAPAKKHCGGFKMPKMKFGCHKKAAPACETAYAPVEYAAPVYAAPQSSPQATGQGM